MVVFIAVARTPIRTFNHAKRTNIGAAWHSTFRRNMMSTGRSMTAVEQEGGKAPSCSTSAKDTGDKVPVVVYLASFASAHCGASSAPINSRHCLAAQLVVVRRSTKLVQAPTPPWGRTSEVINRRPQLWLPGRRQDRPERIANAPQTSTTCISELI